MTKKDAASNVPAVQLTLHNRLKTEQIKISSTDNIQ